MVREKKENILRRCIGFLFRGVYFETFKGSIFKLQVLADGLIGKMLTVLASVQIYKIQAQSSNNQKREQANLTTLNCTDICLHNLLQSNISQ